MNELFDMDIGRVDLVGLPANRRKFALFKSDDEDRSMDMDEEQVVETTEVEEQPVEAVLPEELTKAEERITALEKALEDSKGQVGALEKALALEKTADLPVCKDVGMDVELVYWLTKQDSEKADVVIGKLVEQHKQITELMRELGTAQGEAPEDDELMAAARKVAKAEDISLSDAINQVAKAQPELARRHVAKRQAET